MRILVKIIFCALLLAHAAHAEMKAFFLQHPIDEACRIEVLCDTPDKENDYPLLLLLHGASQDGAKTINPEHFEFWKNQGVAVAAISLPGYGGSNGLKDYCGSRTMFAMHAAIDFIKQEQNITTVGILGFGIGGLAGTLLASQRNDLSCVVSVNGAYDLNRLNDSDDVLRNILIDKKYDIAFTQEEISQRSPQAAIDKIKTPLFLVHRELNALITKTEVLRFAESLNAAGGNCTVRILKGGFDDHSRISHEEVVAEAQNWILWHLN